jgi:hypothetical protein
VNILVYLLYFFDLKWIRDEFLKFVLFSEIISNRTRTNCTDTNPSLGYWLVGSTNMSAATWTLTSQIRWHGQPWHLPTPASYRGDGWGSWGCAASRDRLRGVKRTLWCQRHHLLVIGACSGEPCCGGAWRSKYQRSYGVL